MEVNNQIENSQENHELIDAYLLGNLDSDELAEFEKRIRISQDFRNAVEEQKAAMQAVEEINLKPTLDIFHEEVKDETVNIWMSRGRLALAASVLILIAVSSWAILKYGNSAERVYDANFRPDPGLPTTMGTSSNYNFYYGMVNYKRKEYAEAITRWELLYAADPENDTIVYFLGVANLANGNPRQAEKYLQIARNDSESVFYEEIKHYLALSLLRKNNISEAKTVLQKSENPANIALLKDLQGL